MLTRLRHDLRSSYQLLKVARSLDPVAFTLSLGEIAGRILRGFFPWLAGYCASVWQTRDPSQSWLVLGGLAGCLAAASLVELMGLQARLRMRDIVGHHFDVETAAMVASAPSMDAQFDPQVAKRLGELRLKDGVLGWSYAGLLNAVQGAVVPTLVFSTMVLADVRYSLLLLGAAPVLASVSLGASIDGRAEERAAPHFARSKNIIGSMCSIDSNAELRVLGGWPRLVRRLDESRSSEWSCFKAAADKAGLLSVAAYAWFYGVGVALMTWIAARPGGGLAPGAAVVTGFVGIFTLAGSMESLLWINKAIAQSLRALGSLSTARSRIESLAEASAHHSPGGGEGRLELRDVSYRYAGSTCDALQGVNLSIPRGALVAVVGENGSGKTTLSHLLLGLITPTSGIVRGAAGEQPDSDRNWKSSCLQEFLRFEGGAIEGVLLGDVQGPSEVHATNRQASAEARAKRLLSGLGWTVPSDEGGDVLLGRAWGGRDLSGGQWQRLAVARCLLGLDRELQILDEPSASLDPEAEGVILSRLTHGRDGLSPSGTRVLITHRLSSVRMADLIIVMREGRVVESGSHAELMRSGGMYSDLFSVQASGYVD